MPPLPAESSITRLARLRLLALVCLLSLAAPAVLARPAPEPSPSPISLLYEDGLARMSRGDAEGAVIQFKNVLQQDPNHLPGRIALGEANLRLGNAAGAEKELRIALGLGAAADQVFPVLGNALLAQRKYQDILDTIKSRKPGADGGFEVVLLRGRAHYELGQLEEAETAFTRAHELHEDRSDPLVGLAQVALARGDTDAAAGFIERALAVAPNDIEAWFRKGEVLRQRGDDAGALAAYDHALSINPGTLRVRLARAALRLEYQQMQGALDDTLYVRERNPDDISASFLLWQIYSQQGRREESAAALADITGKLNRYTDEAIANEPLLLRIAALVRFAKRDLVRTEQHLARYVALRPNDSAMQRLHGQVQLLLGDAKSAIASLYPLYKQDPENRDVLVALGQAYLQTGHYRESESMLQAALALYPRDASVTAHLALSRIGLGDMDAAVTGLEEAMGKTSGGYSAAMLLTVLQVKGGDTAGALATIEAVCARAPDDPRALNLLGVVQAANDDLAAARATFERAAALAPDYLPPVYNLARFDLAAGDLTAATARLEAAVERNPRSVSALLALADIASERGDSDTAARWLDKAITASPDRMNAQARLVDLRLSLGQENEAMAAARRMVDRSPEDALAVETMAKVLAASGKKVHALKNFRDAVRYAGFDGPQLLRIAQAQTALLDFPEARRTLIKALKSGSAEDALTTLVRLEIRMGELDAARKRIDELRGDPRLDPLADILTAELHVQSNELDQAIAAYEKAQSKAPSTLAAIGLAEALVARGDLERAIAGLEAWTATYPEDLAALRSLAFMYLPARRFEDAQALHEQLLELEPDDPLLLSNLARLYQLAQDGRARGVAERAVDRAPHSAIALDTLGWILVTEGNTTKGLELLREAISRENNPLIRYHLAQALTELGRIREANVELRQIIQDGTPVELVKDVQAYYDALNAE